MRGVGGWRLWAGADSAGGRMQRSLSPAPQAGAAMWDHGLAGSLTPLQMRASGLVAHSSCVSLALLAHSPLLVLAQLDEAHACITVSATPLMACAGRRHCVPRALDGRQCGHQVPAFIIPRPAQPDSKGGHLVAFRVPPQRRAGEGRGGARRDSGWGGAQDVAAARARACSVGWEDGGPYIIYKGKAAQLQVTVPGVNAPH